MTNFTDLAEAITMISSLKVAEAVICLDKDSQKRCRKFLQSPYFNVSKELTKLYDLILKNDRGKGDMSKETAWRKMRPKTEYDDVRFRKFCSDLLKLIYQFLSHEHLIKEEFYGQYFLLKELKNHSAKKLLINSAERKMERFLADSTGNFANQQLRQYLFEQLKYEIGEYELNRSERSNIETTHHFLDQFYLSEKMDLINTAFARRIINSIPYEVNLIDSTLAAIETPAFRDQPNLQILKLIFFTIRDGGTDEAYYALRDYLQEHAKQFTPKEAMVYYQYAMNYCVRRFNKGEGEFINELFSLYLQILDKGFAIQDGQFNPWLFRNIAGVGIRLKKYEWVKEFIHQYQEFLLPEFRDNAAALNLALIYYYQKNYKGIISQIQNIEYQDLTYSVDSKAMLLVAFYEEGEFDVLNSHVDAFLAYLNRHKDIAPSRRQPRLQLARFTRRLLRVRPWDQKALTKLRKDIEANPIPETPWLLEKLDEIEGKPRSATA